MNAEFALSLVCYSAKCISGVKCGVCLKMIASILGERGLKYGNVINMQGLRFSVMGGGGWRSIFYVHGMQVFGSV